MRARSLKPGFFRNVHLAELPFGARILFEGLWCMADREGRLEENLRRIAADVLPYDRVPLLKWIEGLAERDFILRYEVGGRRYIQITKWTRHQNPHVREAPSSIPPPPGADSGAEHGATPSAAPGGLLTPDSGLLTPSSLTPDSRTPDCGKPPPSAAGSREREKKTGGGGAARTAGFHRLGDLPTPAEIERRRQEAKAKLDRETRIQLNVGRD